MDSKETIQPTDGPKKHIPLSKDFELQTKVQTFMDLLYQHDLVGDHAYCKTHKEFDIYDKSDYKMYVGRKYIWVWAPSLHIGVSTDGLVFQKNSDAKFLCKIDYLLDPNRWGKNISRVRTHVRQGMGHPGESAEIDYDDLHISREEALPFWDLKTGEIKKTRTVQISKMIEERKPVWMKLIVDLGYTKEQGVNFAEGYADELSRFSILGKVRPLSAHYQCMSAGYTRAGIDENEAFERSQKSPQI